MFLSGVGADHDGTAVRNRHEGWQVQDGQL